MSQHEAIEHLRAMPEGELWSLLRSGLTYCRDDIAAAASVTKHEEESAIFDSIARTIKSYMVGHIRQQIEKAEADLAARMKSKLKVPSEPAGSNP